MFGFLERDDLLIVSSLSPLPSPTSASSAMSTDADKFLANLIIKLIWLPISIPSAPSIDNGKFLAYQVRVVLSIEVSGSTNLLKP